MAINNELRAYLARLIPDVYKESIPADEFNTLIDIVCSAYDALSSKIADMKYFYNVDNVASEQLPYLGYLLGFTYDQSLGSLSAYLNQDILRRSQIKNAVAWQKLKGSQFGIKQFLLTLTLDATIKELYYDSTYQNLVEEKIVQRPIANELWEKNITQNSIDYFEGNNGIDTARISSFFSQVVKGNVIFNPAVDGTFKAKIYQRLVSDNSILYKTEIIQNALAGNNFLYVTGSPETPTLPSLNRPIEVDLGTASVAGSQHGPFTFLTGTNDTLPLEVGGITQNVIFITGTYDASVVSNQINNQTVGLIATITQDQRIILTADANAYSAQFKILDHPQTVATTLGFVADTYTATIVTKFDTTNQQLTIGLKQPHDFSKYWTSNNTWEASYGEIWIDYNYIDADNNPTGITEWDYSTGAKSNWFDVEIRSTTNNLVGGITLNSEDTDALVNKIKQDVKPLHALLRSIKFITGFEDNWISPGDQPSFKPWTDNCNIAPETVFQDDLKFSVNNCECQCCLLYDNCVKKIYNGVLRYMFGSGAIKFDFNPCIPGTLLITYDGYITEQGGTTVADTSGVPSVFTNGTDTVTGGLDYTLLVSAGNYVGIEGQFQEGVAKVIAVATNQLTLENNWENASLVGNLVVYKLGKYQYKMTYIANDLIPPQERIIVYYDGRKYFNKKSGKYDCVFHYDLGEFPKEVAQNDEYYTITSSTNELDFSVNGGTPKSVILPVGTYTAEYLAELINFSVIPYLEFFGDGVAYIPQHSDLDVGTGDFTFEFMFKQNDVSGYVWKKRDYVIPRQGYFIYMNDGVPQLWLCDSSANYINSDQKFNEWKDNSFHRCSISVDRSGNAICYIDGEVSGLPFDVSSYSAINLDNTLDAFIGAYPASGFYTGGLTDIRLWKGIALDQATIKTWRFNRVDYSHPYWSYLKAYYKIDEGTGTTIANTIVGGPGNGIISSHIHWITSTPPQWEDTGGAGIKAFGIANFLRILAITGWDPLTQTKSTLDITGSALPVFNFSPIDIMTGLPHAESKVCAMLYNPGPDKIQYDDTYKELAGASTFSIGSPNVTGVGAAFTTWIHAGDKVKLNGDANSAFIIVSSVTDDDNLILTGNYTGAGGTGILIRVRTSNYILGSARTEKDMLSVLVEAGT